MKPSLLSFLFLFFAIFFFRASSLEFVFVTDDHLGRTWTRKTKLENIIEKINELESRISFVVFGGDITNSGSEKEFIEFKNSIKKLNYPFVVAMGNRDARWNLRGDNIFRRLFSEYMKTNPLVSSYTGDVEVIEEEETIFYQNYQVRMNSTIVIVLDWISRDKDSYGSKYVKLNSFTKNWLVDRLSEIDFSIIEKVFFVQHVPFTSRIFGLKPHEKFNQNESKVFVEIITKHFKGNEDKFVGILSGHTHPMVVDVSTISQLDSSSSTQHIIPNSELYSLFAVVKVDEKIEVNVFRDFGIKWEYGSWEIILIIAFICYICLKLVFWKSSNKCEYLNDIIFIVSSFIFLMIMEVFSFLFFGILYEEGFIFQFPYFFTFVQISPVVLSSLYLFFSRYISEFYCGNDYLSNEDWKILKEENVCFLLFEVFALALFESLLFFSFLMTVFYSLIYDSIILFHSDKYDEIPVRSLKFFFVCYCSVLVFNLLSRLIGVTNAIKISKYSSDHKKCKYCFYGFFSFMFSIVKALLKCFIPIIFGILSSYLCNILCSFLENIYLLCVLLFLTIGISLGLLFVYIFGYLFCKKHQKSTNNLNRESKTNRKSIFIKHIGCLIFQLLVFLCCFGANVFKIQNYFFPYTFTLLLFGFFLQMVLFSRPFIESFVCRIKKKPRNKKISLI